MEMVLLTFVKIDLCRGRENDIFLQLQRWREVMERVIQNKEKKTGTIQNITMTVKLPFWKLKIFHNRNIVHKIFQTYFYIYEILISKT